MVDSADSEVYPTPSASCGDSDSGHSTTGPLTPSPNFDAIRLEAGSSDYDYKEGLLISDEGIQTTPRGPPSEAFQCSFPGLSSLASTGYGQPLWQQMDGAAAADVRRPPSDDYLIAGPFSFTNVHPSTEPDWEEVVPHIHPAVSWFYDARADKGRAAVPSVDGAIDPTWLSMPIPQAAYHYSPPVFLYDQEQPQEQHLGVAPADAIGLGSGMQVSGGPRQVVVPQPSSPPLQTTPGESLYANPHRTSPRKHVDKGGANIPSKTPKTEKAKRKQSTEKVFDCPWPGCSKAFARTNNLRVHEKGVHYRMRDHVCPFTGCQKANHGFSRRYDLDIHMQKHHAAELANMPAT
ncbi:hypothetical protein LXA43DRAFT_883824 [Ganoderma leucocontextum]|nr:hypothetical protein LXA43DRAFT_883824 [Ganoderma leucocontextum]